MVDPYPKHAPFPLPEIDAAKLMRTLTSEPNEPIAQPPITTPETDVLVTLNLVSISDRLHALGQYERTFGDASKDKLQTIADAKLVVREYSVVLDLLRQHKEAVTPAWRLVNLARTRITAIRDERTA